MTEIIVAIITGVTTAAAAIITGVVTNRRSSKLIDYRMSLVEQNITNLTEEVRKHNNYAARVPKLEHDVEKIMDDIYKPRS